MGLDHTADGLQRELQGSEDENALGLKYFCVNITTSSHC